MRINKIETLDIHMGISLIDKKKEKSKTYYYFISFSNKIKNTIIKMTSRIMFFDVLLFHLLMQLDDLIILLFVVHFYKNQINQNKTKSNFFLYCKSSSSRFRLLSSIDLIGDIASIIGPTNGLVIGDNGVDGLLV